MGAVSAALCAEIVGTVLDANGNTMPGVKVSTSTQNGQIIGSAVTDHQGDYAINDVSSGLYYVTLNPPAGSGLRGQSVASYVGGTGLTVNWAVAPGRSRWPRRCLGSRTRIRASPRLPLRPSPKTRRLRAARGCRDRLAGLRSRRKGTTIWGRFAEPPVLSRAQPACVSAFLDWSGTLAS